MLTLLSSLQKKSYPNLCKKEKEKIITCLRGQIGLSNGVVFGSGRIFLLFSSFHGTFVMRALTSTSEMRWGSVKRARFCGANFYALIRWVLNNGLPCRHARRCLFSNGSSSSPWQPVPAVVERRINRSTHSRSRHVILQIWSGSRSRAYSAKGLYPRQPGHIEEK